MSSTLTLLLYLLFKSEVSAKMSSHIDINTRIQKLVIPRVKGSNVCSA